MLIFKTCLKRLNQLSESLENKFCKQRKANQNFNRKRDEFFHNLQVLKRGDRKILQNTQNQKILMVNNRLFQISKDLNRMHYKVFLLDENSNLCF